MQRYEFVIREGRLGGIEGLGLALALLTGGLGVMARRRQMRGG